jgi:hypothetical protein
MRRKRRSQRRCSGPVHERVAHGCPGAMQRAGCRRVAGAPAERASAALDRGVYGGEDVEQSDLVRWPGERKAASLTASGREQARDHQTSQDLRQVMRRDARRAREIAGAQRGAGRADRKPRSRTQGVLGGLREERVSAGQANSIRGVRITADARPSWRSEWRAASPKPRRASGARYDRCHRNASFNGVKGPLTSSPVAGGAEHAGSRG